MTKKQLEHVHVNPKYRYKRVSRIIKFLGRKTTFKSR